MHTNRRDFKKPQSWQESLWRASKHPPFQHELTNACVLSFMFINAALEDLL